MNAPASGRIVVISGPSGAGKTTLVKRLFRRCDRLVASVSATTRPPRPGEQDGVDYHFLVPEEFTRRQQAGQFIECFEVFGRGYWYGTLWNEVTPSLAAGKWVVLEIDVQGTLAVRQRYPDAITIFVRPGAIEELEHGFAIGERNRPRPSSAARSRPTRVGVCRPISIPSAQ